MFRSAPIHEEEACPWPQSCCNSVEGTRFVWQVRRCVKANRCIEWELLQYLDAYDVLFEKAHVRQPTLNEPAARPGELRIRDVDTDHLSMCTPGPPLSEGAAACGQFKNTTRLGAVHEIKVTLVRALKGSVERCGVLAGFEHRKVKPLPPVRVIQRRSRAEHVWNILTVLRTAVRDRRQGATPVTHWSIPVGRYTTDTSYAPVPPVRTQTTNISTDFTQHKIYLQAYADACRRWWLRPVVLFYFTRRKMRGTFPAF